MNKLLAFGAATVAMFAVTGCSNQDFSDFWSGNDDENSIKAVMYDESASRSDADDNGKFTWAKGDDIAVFSGSAVKKYNLSSGEGTNSATFSPVEQSAFTLASQYAVYPYNAEHALADNTLTVNLPSEYTYSIAEDGSVVTNTNAAMLGTLEDGTFQFRHLAGVLRLMFDALPAGTKALKFETNSRINGKYEVEIAGDEIPELKQDDAAVADGNNIVTINLESALAKAQKNVRFMIPLPTGTYKGFKFSILDADGNILKNDNGLDLVYETATENEMVRRQLGIYPTLYLNVSIDGVIESEVETAEDLKIALESGKYVRLANDIDLSGTAVSVPYNEKASVDLNGKTLTLGASTANSDYITVHGTLTIKDSSTNKVGKIARKTGTSYPLVYVQTLNSNYLADLTLDGITVNAQSTIFSYVGLLSTLNINNCVFNCSGGYIVQAYDYSTININGDNTNITASRIVNIAGDKASININGGESLSAKYCIYDSNSTKKYSTTVNILGGTLKATDYSILVRNNSEVKIADSNIEGGTMYLLDKSSLKMTSGSISQTTCAIWGYDNSTIDISGDVEISATNTAIKMHESASAIFSGSATINSSGNFGVDIEGSGKISVKDNAQINAVAYAIYARSTAKSNIKISDKSAVTGGYYGVRTEGVDTIAVSGGTVKGTSYHGICVDGIAKIDISGTANIIGKQHGIYVKDSNADETKSCNVKIAGGTITAGGGVTATKNSACYGVNMSSNKGSFKMTGGSISSAGYGVGLLGYPTATIEGGKIEAEAFALAGNGTYYSDRVDYKISGGELISTNAYAIYLPNATTTEISGTAKISGWGAVDLQRGNLSISDSAELTADAAEAATIPATGDGTAGLQFAAVNISGRYGDLTLNITGGKFTARNHASIIDNTYNGHTKVESDDEKERWIVNRTVNITGGYFSSDPSSVAIKTYNDKYTEISTENTNFLSSGYKAVETTDGYYQVVADTAD
jgi:hypothetical protein